MAPSNVSLKNLFIFAHFFIYALWRQTLCRHRNSLEIIFYLPPRDELLDEPPPRDEPPEYPPEKPPPLRELLPDEYDEPDE